MSRHTIGPVLALLAALSLSAACELPPPPDDGVSANQFSDIPIPEGLRLHERAHASDAVIKGNYRYANYKYSGTIPVAKVSSYLRERMPQHRWQLISEESESPRDEVLRFRRGKSVAECHLVRLELTTEMTVTVRTTYEHGK